MAARQHECEKVGEELKEERESADWINRSVIQKK
jgi:hypothetical protein